MKYLYILISIILITTSCSGNGASEKEREDSIRIADSIATVREAEELAEQARLDSIKEANRLTPYAFIKRASSVTYEFLGEYEIFSNFKKLGFNAGKTKTTDRMEHPDCVDFDKEITFFTRTENGETTQVKVISYGVDRGGINTTEEYIIIDFGNEKEKDKFIEKILNLRFANKNDSKITIGDGEKYYNIYVDYSKPLKVEIYNEEAIPFMKY